MCLEDAGFCKKGEIGPFLASTDITYKGTLPVNTDGGQLSSGQLNPAGASGCQQIAECYRQLTGRAADEGRQVADHDLGFVNV